MLLKIFVAHNLLCYGLALFIYFNRDFSVDVYQLIDAHADKVPGFAPSVALMVICAMLGNYAYKLCFSKRNLRAFEISNNSKPPLIKRRLGYGAISIAIAVNISLMYGILGNNFLIRDTYHDLLGESGILLIVSKAFLFVSIIAIHGYSRTGPTLRWIAVIFLMLLSLNYSSVMSSAYPLGLLFFDAVFLRKSSLLRVVTYLVVTFGIMMCAVYFRSMSSHGILPYFSEFEPTEFLAGARFALYYVWPFSTYVSLATLNLYQPSLEATLIMLNPLPGGLAGWPSIGESMVVQFNVPYSTMGMVFATGTWFLVAFYFMLGYVFSYFDSTIARFLYIQKYVSAVVVVAFGCYIIVLHGGWELRSTMRMIYYCSLFCFFSNFISTKRIPTYRSIES